MARLTVTFSGSQGSDIVARTMATLAARKCAVEDVSLSQSNRVDLQVSVTFTADGDPKDVIGELSGHATETECSMRYQLDQVRRDSFGPNPLTKFSATVLNDNGLSPEFMHRWMSLLHKFDIQIDRIERLNDGPLFKVADFRLSVPSTVDLADFRGQSFQLSVEQGTDIAILPYNVYRKNKRLVVFDMDSTLIQQEVIDELAKHAGVVDKVAVGITLRI